MIRKLNDYDYDSWHSYSISQIDFDTLPTLHGNGISIPFVGNARNPGIIMNPTLCWVERYRELSGISTPYCNSLSPSRSNYIASKTSYVFNSATNRLLLCS